MPTTSGERSRSKLIRGGRGAGVVAARATDAAGVPDAAAADRGRALAERQHDGHHAEQHRRRRPGEDRAGRGERDREPRRERASAMPRELGGAEPAERLAGARGIDAHEERARGGHEDAEAESADRAAGDEVPGLAGERRADEGLPAMSSTPATPIVRARPRSAYGATMSSAASEAAKPAAATKPMLGGRDAELGSAARQQGEDDQRPDDMSTVAVTTPTVSRRRSCRISPEAARCPHGQQR